MRTRFSEFAISDGVVGTSGRERRDVSHLTKYCLVFAIEDTGMSFDPILRQNICMGGVITFCSFLLSKRPLARKTSSAMSRRVPDG